MEKLLKDLNERLLFLEDSLKDHTPKLNSDYTTESIPIRIKELKSIISIVSKLKS